MARRIRPALLGIPLFLLISAGLASFARGAAIQALLVGGGPDKENNTAQIEQHLRFVTALVPASPERIVLFADGKPDSHTLSYTDSSRLSPGQLAMDVLLPNDELGAKVMTRKPDVGAPLSGPSRLSSIHRGFQRLMRQETPVLLYFAGHGSTVKNDESVYNLWGGENLDAPTLAREIAQLPPKTPVTLVMAQCFSGGFGSILYRNADPDQPPVDRTLAAFFAAESDREAAGCGTETGSPVYQDFSSYFFGALSGHDRLGHAVTGADYDGDGKVTCHEAFCYALIHDESIDTPVCGSMLFLRRAVDMSDADIYNASYSSISAAATPAQRAALEALSSRLGVTGEQRLLDAYDRLTFSQPVARSQQMQAYGKAQDDLNAVRQGDLHALFTRWPGLRWRDGKDYEKASKGAIAELDKDATRCREIEEAQDRFDRADTALDMEEALLFRFTALCEEIVRAQHLRASGTAETKARYERIWRAEQNPLPLTATADGSAAR